MIDKRPALIVRCADAGDVVAAVDFARRHNLELAVRGGGHSVAGHAMSDGGVTIDLSPLKAVAVEPAARTVRAEAGATLGELDADTQAHGLAVPAGQVSHTGIAGLTLGGGTGWLMRKYGLTIDNLLAVELVTADGGLLTASEEANRELFWAVRGGGGNFGVATAFVFRGHPVGPLVLAGPVFYTLDRAGDALRCYRELMASAPDELTAFAVLMTAPAAPPFPERLRGRQLLAIDVCYAGPVAEGEAAVRPLRAFGPPDLDLIAPLPYTVHQRMLDATAPHGLHHYNRSGYLRELGDAAIDALLDRFAGVTSPWMSIQLARMGGAIERVPEEATAFGGRGARYLLWIIGMWEPAGDGARHVAWVRGTHEAMLPHSTGGVYVNALGEEGAGRVRAAYGPATYARLVRLKDRYDPTNLFRLNQNIPPSAAGARGGAAGWART